MKIHIGSPKDFYAGLIFLCLGAGAAWIARDYPMGTAIRMGPGYFPLVLGWLLGAIGVAACAKGLILDGERIERVGYRPLLLILGAVGLFAVGIERAGIIVSTLLAVSIAAAASTDSRLREVVLLLVFLIALAVGVFTYALGLPFKLVPG